MLNFDLQTALENHTPIVLKIELKEGQSTEFGLSIGKTAIHFPFLLRLRPQTIIPFIAGSILLKLTTGGIDYSLTTFDLTRLAEQAELIIYLTNFVNIISLTISGSGPNVFVDDYIPIGQFELEVEYATIGNNIDA